MGHVGQRHLFHVIRLYAYRRARYALQANSVAPHAPSAPLDPPRQGSPTHRECGTFATCGTSQPIRTRKRHLRQAPGTGLQQTMRQQPFPKKTYDDD
jgi:hypothetical protein